MQFKGKDGSSHGSQMQAYQSSQSAPAASSSDASQPGDITQNPQAMDCIDKLKSMGYTADDVAQAMGDDTQSSGMDSGAQATQVAPLNIPGM